MHFASNITRVRVRIAALALALVLTSAVLAACGSDDNTQHGGAGASTSTPAKSTSTATVDTGSTEAGAGVTDYVKYVGGTAGAADASKSPIVIGYILFGDSFHILAPWGTFGRGAAAPITRVH
jgi:predicted small secreted protein